MSQDNILFTFKIDTKSKAWLQVAYISFEVTHFKMTYVNHTKLLLSYIYHL